MTEKEDKSQTGILAITNFCVTMNFSEELER